MKVLANISRVLVGLLFIFSGYIKANDPLGFSYKLEEYYHVFGLDFLVSSAVYQAMFICVLEMILGVALLLGSRMKVTATLLLAMIIFFTLLTGYTAISNWFFENPESGTTKWFANLLSFKPKELYYMTDCGCFGEFLKLTPWQSFIKDLVLLLFIIIIFVRRKHFRSLFSRNMQTNIIVTFSVLFIGFTVYCYMYLPFHNFLNWKAGNDVKPLILRPEGAPKDSIEQVFIYKLKDGKEIPISYDSVMAMKIPEGAEYVDTKTKVLKEGWHPKILGFSIFGKDTDENSEPFDYKDSLLNYNDFQLLVISYDLEHARERSLKKIAEVTKEFIMTDKKIVWGLTGTTLSDAEKIRHDYQLMFNMYNVDPKMLKSMIRSNPGLILMKGSVVVDTWPSRNIPSAKKLRKIMESYNERK